MKRFISAVPLALAVLSVLGFANPVAAQVPVPFQGTIDGFVAITPKDATTNLGLFQGRGVATQLGQFAVSLPHEIDTVKKVATGTYLFVAANGDKLCAKFEGGAAPTATPGILLITEKAIITGGTGRFIGATGSFTCQRAYRLATLRQTGSFVGTITLRGAAK